MRTTEQAGWYLEEVIQELRTRQAAKAIERTAKETELVGWRREDVMQELRAQQAAKAVERSAKETELVGWHLEDVMRELREWHEREEREIAQLRWEMWVEASSDDDE